MSLFTPVCTIFLLFLKGFLMLNNALLGFIDGEVCLTCL